MTQYTFSNLNSNTNEIPAKTRTVRKSPLYARMEKLKVGEGFVVNDAQMASVAANIYATAKRAGIKVTLRQLEEGVGVWRQRNSTSAQSETKQESTVPAKKRRVVKGNGKGNTRKAA